jgi:uncharacterized DUF497 family protein
MHKLSPDIEFDPAKSRANLKKHGVSFSHAEQALRDPFAVTIVDEVSDDDELRFVTLGMDALGRLLVVIHTSRGRSLRLISARRATRRETEQYHA